MGANFTPEESFTLYQLLAENTSDVILKTDCDGFVSYASSALERLGVMRSVHREGFHLLDLVHETCAEAVAAEHAALVSGRKRQSWIEFPAASSGNAAGGPERWFEIRMRRLVNKQGQVVGTINVMRSIQDRVALEDKLFAAAMTDPLTGLANRTAFISMLQHLVDAGNGGCLAIVAIDYFKAINMRLGQSIGDEVLVVFSELLRTLMRPEDIVARIGGESLAILMPDVSPDTARALCEHIVSTLSAIRQSVGAGGTPITASIGVSPICGSLDDTMTRAEMALFLAKAKGRNRLEVDDGRPLSRMPGQSWLPGEDRVKLA